MKFPLLAGLSFFAAHSLFAQVPVAPPVPAPTASEQASPLATPTPDASAATPSGKPFIVTEPVAPAHAKPTPANHQVSSPTPTAAPNPTPLTAKSAPTPELDSQGRPIARAQAVSSREIITELQIFLDQQKFGPGKIDGSWGEFTQKALGRYELAHGLPATAHVPYDSVYPIYTTYTIKPEDAKWVGNLPEQPSRQAKLKMLPYPSFVEFIAERFHSDPDFIRRLNPTLKGSDFKVGETIRVPNVVPFVIENLKEIASLPPIDAYLKRAIKIDTHEKMLDLYDGEKLLASFPITPGSSRLPAPKGKFTIIGIAEFPWFRWDKGVLEHGVRTNNYFNLPSGPRNPVGVLWMGLNKPGIGIHGTESPFTIGRSGSHGCIRLANWDAIRLSEMVTKGMTVFIY